MSTVKTVKYQVGTDGTSTNNFTIYQPDPPDGTMRVGNGNADSVTDAITLDSSGNITAAQNLTVSGNLSVTGNIPVNNTAPLFIAYANDAQTIATATFTKVQCNTEVADTNSNYDHSTNYRFTPTVAGYYQITGAVGWTTAPANGDGFIALYKNGSVYRYISNRTTPSSANRFLAGTCLMYMNGTTDYVELYVYQNTGGNLTTFAGSSQRRECPEFQGVLVSV